VRIVAVAMATDGILGLVEEVGHCCPGLRYER
jgi:hypothetical protein